MEETIFETSLDDLAIEDMVICEEGKSFTTSRIIAKVFEKEHKDVLRAISNLECSSQFTERNFALSEYTDPTGRKLPAYRLTRDGFSFLAMGFTGKKAAAWKEKFLEAFNMMEKALLEKSSEQNIRPQVEAEKVESVQVPARLVPFRKWNKITPEMLSGLTGLLKMESYLQNIPYEENVRELLSYYRVGRIEDLLRKNVNYILIAVIARLFFISPERSTDESLSEDLKTVMEGLLQFWYTISENASENIDTYLYNKCGIKSLSEVQTNKDALKVILAIWGGVSIDIYK